jgi:hypothetical protein
MARSAVRNIVRVSGLIVHAALMVLVSIVVVIVNITIVSVRGLLTRNLMITKKILDNGQGWVYHGSIWK